MLNGEPLQPFEAQALDEINTRPFPSDLPFDAGLMKFWSNQNLVQYMIGAGTSGFRVENGNASQERQIPGACLFRGTGTRRAG